MIKYKLKNHKTGKSPVKSPFKKKLKHTIIPDTKPLPLKVGALIFLGINVFGILISNLIALYLFFGAISLVGLVALIESNKYLKYIATKSNRLIDILIFATTIHATLSLGIMITASLTIVGLGYTLVYAPWLRYSNNK